MTYAAYKANAEAAAAAWMEAHADELYEQATDTRLEFGCEYFDYDAQAIDLDGMDYYTRLGQASVSESRATVYRVAPEFEGTTRPIGYVECNHANIYSDDMSRITVEGREVEVLPYRGEPRTVRKASAGRNNSHQLNTAEQHRIRQLANKDAQKARRYAKKHQVSLTAAMDHLGF